MTENPAKTVNVLAKVMMDATETEGVLRDELTVYVDEIAAAVITAIRAKTEQGTELRAALGVEVTQTTRMGKNISAAMDAYSGPKPVGEQSS